jgi:hypothetical protein
MGNRGSVYITNSDYNGLLQLGVGGSHAQNPKLVISNNNAYFTESLGIGTTSPDANLEIDGGNLSKFRISGNGNNGANNEFGSIEFYNNDTSGASPNVASSIKALSSSSTGSGGLLTFSTSIGNEAEGTDANERMRITPTGNVGIGTTSPNANLEISKIGTAEVRVSGLPSGSGYGGNANLWLQTGTYGTSEIAFGPAVAGTAATASGGIEYNDYYKKLTFKTNYSDRVVINSTGNVGIGTTTANVRLEIGGGSTLARVIPSVNNQGYIGDSSHRWQAIYATNGTIVTSDVREKEEIKSTQLGLDFVNDLNPVSFKWIDNERLDASKDKRNHQGLIAQEVAKTLEKHGVNKNEFGGLDIQKTDEYDDFHAMSYEQLIAPMIKAIQELKAEIEELKKQINK